MRAMYHFIATGEVLEESWYRSVGCLQLDSKKITSEADNIDFDQVGEEKGEEVCRRRDIVGEDADETKTKEIKMKMKMCIMKMKIWKKRQTVSTRIRKKQVVVMRMRKMKKRWVVLLKN